MVTRFEQVWKPDWNARACGAEAHAAPDRQRSRRSSEKEVRRGEERPLVAAVYSNRLADRMPLQADPTVQYAQKKRPGRACSIATSRSTRRTTRIAAWACRPGPIASPGAASIEAALFPATVPYKFFVARPDGRHEFTADFRAHETAVKAARREWDSVAALRKDSAR